MSEKSFASLKILIVEDSPDNRVLIGLFLKSMGILQVDYALNGLEGFEKARRVEYDVVLMDINMPIMDGTTAMLKLRESGFQRPIIALTANALDLAHTKAQALQLGFTEYLTKPINRRVLLENLQRLSETCF